MRIILTLIASLAGIFASFEATGRGGPNILWIISEDMSHDIACYGNAVVRTPNLDKLARGGMRYSRMFATAAVQKHFIDTRINDKERYRQQRLKGYLGIEKQLRRAGQI